MGRNDGLTPRPLLAERGPEPEIFYLPDSIAIINIVASHTCTVVQN